MDTKIVFINVALERVLLFCISLGGDPVSPSDRVIMQIRLKGFKVWPS